MILGYKTLKALAPVASWSKKVTGTAQAGKKPRTQYVPNNAIRLIHAHALQRISEKLVEFNITFPSATAFVKKGGIDKHFARHVNNSGYFNQYWFVTDISKAYDSVDMKTLCDILLQLFFINPNPYPKGSNEWHLCEDFFKASPVPIKVSSEFNFASLYQYLIDYFANPETGKGLAEGFPMSPFLFNLYAELVLDQKLRALCEQYKITYSRFADDLIFTCDEPMGKVRRKKIKEAIGSWFAINDKKTLFFDIHRYPQGVVLNKTLVRNRNGQAEISMVGDHKRRFKRLLYFAHQREDAAQKPRLCGIFGSFSQKTKFLGTTFPEYSKNSREIIQLFRGYIKIAKESESFLSAPVAHS